MSRDSLLEKATPAVACCFFLNHLLVKEGWARDRLAPFAGEAVELRAPLLPAVRVSILQDGRVEAGRVEAGGAAAALTVTVKPEVLRALGRGQDHLMRAVEVAGNARLAAEVMLLARHLRWDAEEDLSRLVGDVAAHRIGQGVRALVAWQMDAARRFAAALADYAADEKRVLIRRADLEAHAGHLAALRDALERLGKRIDRLA